MNHLQIVELMQHAMPDFSGHLPKEARKYTPSDIRLGIQAFAAQGNMAMVFRNPFTLAFLAHENAN